MRGTPFGAWRWEVYGGNELPAFRDWGIKAWASFPHLQASAASPSGKTPLDRAANARGAARKISAVVTQCSMAVPILAQTDMLLTVPSVAIENAATCLLIWHHWT